jgi:hypothetical protein
MRWPGAFSCIWPILETDPLSTAPLEARPFGPPDFAMMELAVQRDWSQVNKLLPASRLRWGATQSDRHGSLSSPNENSPSTYILYFATIDHLISF